MKSHNHAHAKSLRTQSEIRQEYNQIVTHIGHIIAQVHLMHKQKGELLCKVERLEKEQARPEPKPEASKPPEEAIVEAAKEELKDA